MPTCSKPARYRLKTESARDFEDLKTKITDGLKAWIRKEGSLGKLEPAPIESLAETSVVAEVAELDFLERTALTTLAKALRWPWFNYYIL